MKQSVTKHSLTDSCVAESTKPLLLHIVTVPQTLSSFFAGQIEYMKSKGFAVAAISSPGEQIEFVERRDNIRVYQISMLRRISPLADIVAVFRLLRIIKRLRPTIVHCHTPKAVFLGILTAYFARVPVRVFTLHGLRGWGVAGVKKWILDTTEKLSCRLAQKVFAVSHSVCQEVLKRGYCDEGKIQVLANGTCNGVDAKNRFNPGRYGAEVRSEMRRKYGIPDDAMVLCYVGRIVRDKGMSELIAAWQKLRGEFDNLYLLMVGEYESQDAVGSLEAQILSNDDRIVITGFVQEMPEHYLAADRVTLPTYREGFPYAPLESAAMELAIVATRVCGCVDAIEDGRTGVLVPAKDAEALYSAIKELLSNKPLREKMGWAARKRVLERFAPEMVWEALYSQYIELMCKHEVQ